MVNNYSLAAAEGGICIRNLLLTALGLTATGSGGPATGSGGRK